LWTISYVVDVCMCVWPIIQEKLEAPKKYSSVTQVRHELISGDYSFFNSGINEKIRKAKIFWIEQIH
jgi:hypothetical protein